MNKPLSFAVVLLLLVSGRSSAHPVHASLAEAEWKPATKTLEVALKVQPIDLEQALERRTKKPIDLDKTKGVDDLIQAYLKDVFVVKDATGKELKLNWVGKEINVKEGWIYFEVPLEKGLDGVKFSNRLFFELNEGEVNTMTFKEGKKRKSLTFSHSKPEQVLEW